MLEIKNLTKIYKPKKGVPVTALDGVSLKFPEKGMIFLLGKSGSGKSTLLNLIGGLDTYDSGEILIKGTSSLDFSQSRFDSYRNTYVGFIFQEYNILPEFTVGANIALALELQGQKASDERINEILREVDLVGYGNRKPNELSGGQLQRVAIARALVKNPEIIMADEPTGALDSNTGKQVFDTLKKLASDKLVIIVSHDREYAEYYADRIIELADGKVIDDVELDCNRNEDDAALEYVGGTVNVPFGYHLTEADRIAINEYIDSLSTKASIRFSGRSKNFRKTDESVIPPQDPSKFKLIKSKLPMKSAFKIGAGALTHKKFRLVMTIFLSVIAFTLFALVDTFSSYDHINTCTNSIMDSDINYASVKKSKRYGEGVDSYWRTWGFMLSREEIAELSKDSGVAFKGVYVPDDSMSLDEYTDTNSELYTDSDYMIHSMSLSGFAEMTKDDVTSLGYTLAAGKMPENSSEIAITSYVCETFKIGGYVTTTSNSDGSVSSKTEKITSEKDMIGKKLTFGNKEYTIVGVIDTKFDLSRYKSLTEEKENNSTADNLVDYLLFNELGYAANYSFNNLAVLCEGGVEELIASGYKTIPLESSYMSLYYDYSDDNYTSLDPYRIGKYSDLDLDQVIWLDGKSHDKLGENEVVVTTDCIYSSLQFIDTSVEPTVGEDGELIFESDYSALIDIEFYGHCYYGNQFMNLEGYRVVGVIDNINDEQMLLSPQSIYVCDDLYTNMTADVEGEFEFAVGVMPENRSDIKKLLEYCYDETDDVRFPMQNSVTYELDTVNESLEVLSVVFLWIGIGFAVFAALMLANFIAQSVTYKKHEIGILRAIGSRSNDVFRIFFSESFIIAMINFVLAAVATFAVTAIINGILREEIGLLITILSFGIRQILLIFAVSVCVAAVASFIPVKKIASKRPIDAIRGK